MEELAPCHYHHQWNLFHQYHLVKVRTQIQSVHYFYGFAYACLEHWHACLALCWIKEEFQVAAALHYSAYIVSAVSLHMEAVYVLR